MRDFKKETELRVAFIKEQLKRACAKGIVFANSGGKDCALVGILCKMACENTIGVILPCASKQNYASDKTDALALSARFNIESREVDLTETRETLLRSLSPAVSVTDAALINIAPRLRMTTIYTIAASEGLLVAGTGNLSERYVGYFTKWGDGACDFNPISDLTVGEVYDFLRFLGAPDSIISKAPSAGLYDGQTDEKDMGITYDALDKFILTGDANEHDRAIIERYHAASAHKRATPPLYGGPNAHD